jgi:hypothetical protein
MRRLAFVVGLAAALFAVSLELGWLDRSPAPAVTDTPTPETPPATAPAPATATATPVRPDPAPPAAPRAPVAPTPEPEPKTPTTATLRIDSDVPGAQVFVDNKFIGTAPATADGVAPGQRKINVQAPGYDSVSEFHDVVAGPRDIVISLKTIRLDQKTAVTHKHGAGSCSGTLIATPEGLRYETSHKDDGFRVALTNIETFDADFLKNNLKVKIRGGRNYDFTDPSGKADALYLFHQEVEKVRKRLQDGGK